MSRCYVLNQLDNATSDLTAFKIPQIPSSVLAALGLYSRSFGILNAVEPSLALFNYYWASEESPIVGCSIKISRDILEKWFPLQSQRAHSLKTFFKFYIKSKLKSFLFLLFFSSFLLRRQGQPELCGCYHLLQSCFSFYVCLHGELELFARDHLL